MISDPPEAWLRLSAHERDILVTLDVDGPCSGKELSDRVGLDIHYSSTHRGLQNLLEADLISVEPKDGRENNYQVTSDGASLLSVVRGWME